MNKSVRTIWRRSQEGIVESRKGKVDMTEKEVEQRMIKGGENGSKREYE